MCIAKLITRLKTITHCVRSDALTRARFKGVMRMISIESIFVRQSLVLISWLIFWLCSSFYHSNYSHDIGASFWALGVFATPIVVTITSLFDKSIGRNFFLNELKLLTSLQCMLAIALYVPLTFFIVLTAGLIYSAA